MQIYSENRRVRLVIVLATILLDCISVGDVPLHTFRSGLLFFCCLSPMAPDVQPSIQKSKFNMQANQGQGVISKFAVLDIPHTHQTRVISLANKMNANLKGKEAERRHTSKNINFASSGTCKLYL